MMLFLISTPCLSWSQKKEKYYDFMVELRLSYLFNVRNLMKVTDQLNPLLKT